MDDQPGASNHGAPTPGDVPYLPPSPAAPSANPADLYARVTSLQWVASLAGVPVLLTLWAPLAYLGHVTIGPAGVMLAFVVACAANMFLTARFGFPLSSYRRIRRPMYEQLGAYYGTDFARDWRIGYARGKTRPLHSGKGGDSSEDFGFLRLAPQQVEFYGVKTSFHIPRAAITEVGLVRCALAQFWSRLALCREGRRPFITYRLPDGSEHSVNFTCLDGLGWPGNVHTGIELGAELERWLRSGAV